ncbi:DUF4173 domain-containing protein [Actinoplanes sp. LDG1-06]|uniref:DUF4173 domain-containing protein n=1 Tax=Paractinoplanes ovalisporus TaxID=2810368 RepID=A0ABS2AAY5_9ACTN|nr:DUF4173 domain-containing protein [Actinoplanes ovalisporus]MBM2616982.1 DUF4173 domain-containing protein [Actinoplanes ovalisporus]
MSSMPWGRQWAGPGRPASVVTVAAVAGAAAVAALGLPLDRPGIGWLLTALAAVAAVAVADTTRVTRGPKPLVVRSRPRLGAEQIAWAAATVALFAVGTFRSAGWLFTLCVLVAGLTTALALAGGRSMRSIFVACTLPFFAALRAVPWLARGLSRPGEEKLGNSRVRIVATAVVSAVLLVAFGALLASADERFAHALERLVPDLGVDTVFRWIFVGGFAAMGVGGAAFLRAAPPDMSKLDRTQGRKVHRWEWAVPLGLLTFLFAAFVAVQAVTLFRGDFGVQEYADEARSGFWQLSWVVGLTLLVLAGAARWAPRENPADRLLIRVILGTLTALTLVIAATAIQRITLYTAEYGLTRLRLLVLCCELWFVFVLLLVLVAGRRIRAAWLPRVAIAAGVSALLGLAVANPDAMIAERNVQQHGNRPIDLSYLGDLSPDAVPALTRSGDLTPEQLRCVLGRLNTGPISQPDDWRSWNLGREQARLLIAARGNPTFDCTP